MRRVQQQEHEFQRATVERYVEDTPTTRARRSLWEGADRRRRGSRNGFGRVSKGAHRGNARLPTGLESVVLGSRNHPRSRSVEDAEPRLVVAIRATGETTGHRGCGVARRHHLADGRLRDGIRRRCRHHDRNQEGPDTHTWHGFSGVEASRLSKAATSPSA